MSEYTDYLKHHGVKGMQWGRRLYQNEDGSLTAAGKKRYRAGGGTSLTGYSPYQSDGKGNKLDVITTSRTNKNPLTSVKNGHISVSTLINNNESYAVKSNGTKVTLTPVNKRSIYDRTHFTSDGKLESVDVDYTGRGGVSMDDEQAYKVLTSEYADLGDEDLDKLYELTGDVEILKYRNKRHSEVIKAGEEYAKKSIVSKVATTVSSLVSNYADESKKKTWNKVESFITNVSTKLDSMMTVVSAQTMRRHY